MLDSLFKTHCRSTVSYAIINGGKGVPSRICDDAGDYAGESERKKGESGEIFVRSVRGRGGEGGE